MVQTLSKTVTFTEFINWKPEGNKHELHNGVVVEMNQPLGEHEDIICFLNAIITTEFLRLNLNYGISKTALVKPSEAESVYSPDILILNRSHLKNEPLWQKMSTVSQGTSIPLIVEIISTNWKVEALLIDL